jgi:hypothetical protein
VKKKPGRQGGHSPRWVAVPEKIIIIISAKLRDRALKVSSHIGTTDRLSTKFTDLFQV